MPGVTAAVPVPKMPSPKIFGDGLSPQISSEIFFCSKRLQLLDIQGSNIAAVEYSRAITSPHTGVTDPKFELGVPKIELRASPCSEYPIK